MWLTDGERGGRATLASGVHRVQVVRSGGESTWHGDWRRGGSTVPVGLPWLWPRSAEPCACKGVGMLWVKALASILASGYDSGA
jgi:hypothetical protein